MLSISNLDLTDEIYWCLFYDPLNFIWVHIHVLFMAMKTYFHDPTLTPLKLRYVNLNSLDVAKM